MIQWDGRNILEPVVNLEATKLAAVLQDHEERLQGLVP